MANLMFSRHFQSGRAVLGFPHVLDELDITCPLLSNFTFRVYISYYKFVWLEIIGFERKGGRKQRRRKRAVEEELLTIPSLLETRDLHLQVGKALKLLC